MKVYNVSKQSFGLKPIKIETPNKVINFVRDTKDNVISYSVRDKQGRLIKEFSKTTNGNKSSLVIDEYQYNHDFASIKDIHRIDILKANDNKYIKVSKKSINSSNKNTEIYLNDSGSLNKAYLSSDNPDDNFIIKSIKGRLIKIFGNE